MWDFSLVDPDNRRPVDYGERTEALAANEPPASLLATWQDGRIKQRVLAAILADRAQAPDLYASGDYQPLRPRGSASRSVLGFTRAGGDSRLAVLVPRLVAGRLRDGLTSLGEVWGDTSVSLPAGRWRDVVTGESRQVGENPTPVSELFRDLPLSVLRAEP
jgi:(1->4)-alpha-D-glucan 1-alpha-D-glucosylmutase